jgi:hypothetical protein
MRITRNIQVVLLLAVLPGAIGSCTNDSEEELYGKPSIESCEVSQVTYALTVRPILQQHCYSCHSSSFPSGNVTLDDYTGVKRQMDNGHLLGSIKHLPGHPAMPQGGPKLSDCQIARITKWYESGSLNN